MATRLDRFEPGLQCSIGYRGGGALFGLKRGFWFLGAATPKPGLGGRGKEWCILALLYAAARSDAATDKDITAEEEVTLDSLASRTRSLFGLSQDLMESYLAEHRAMLEGRNSVDVLVEAACESLPREDGLPEALFAQCADIVMADREIVSIEDEFLRDLAERLRLPRSKHNDILQVMRWKNEMRDGA